MRTHNKNRVSYDYIILAVILLFSAFLYYSFAALPQPANDDIYYMETAYSLVSGGPILASYPYSVVYGVVFPLALLYKLFGFSMYAGIYYQILLTLISTLLVYKIAKLYSRYSGIIAAAIFAFLPAVIGTSNVISPDMFTLACALAAVFLLLKYRSHKSDYSNTLHGEVLLVFSGFFSFASTFGSFLGDVFLVFYIISSAYLLFNSHRGKKFLFALFGIVLGFLISIPPSYLLSNDIYLAFVVGGHARYPFLVSNWDLARFLAYGTGIQPSSVSGSLNGLFSNLTATFFLVPNAAIRYPAVIEFDWPYAYGFLFYLLLISFFIIFKYKKIKRSGFLIAWALFMGLPQLFILILLILDNNLVYYFSTFLANIAYFRFELLLVTPLIIICGYALSEYMIGGKNRSRMKKHLLPYAIVVVLILVTVAVGIYSSALYSQKNIFITNIYYYGVKQLATELHGLNVGNSPGVYLQSIMVPGVSGVQAIMFYSSLYGLNPNDFKNLPSTCEQLPDNAYVVLEKGTQEQVPGYHFNTKGFFANCTDVSIIYNTSNNESNYNYTLYRIN